MINKGIYPALLTPFKEDNSVDYDALSDLIEFNIAKGVSGFYVTGSTAEVFMLTSEERKNVMKTVYETVRGRCSLIAHVGCIGTDEAISYGKYAEKLGFDAISSVPPFYYNFPKSAIMEYYKDISSHVDLPMIVYNIPAFSGVSFTIEDIDLLLSDSRIIGVKNTANDYFIMEKMKRHNPDKIIFNGYDETYLAGLSMGADGAIGSTFNFMAEKFIRMKAYFEDCNIDAAKKEQNEANIIIEALCSVGVMQGEKAILRELGINVGKCRRPFMEISKEKERDFIDTVMRHL